MSMSSRTSDAMQTQQKTLRVVAGTYSGLLYGWEYNPVVENASMKLTFGYAAHLECIKSVSLMKARGGRTLLSGGNDESIKIYNVDKRVEVGTLMEQTGAITSLDAFSHSHVLSGSADNSICIWRVSDWNCLHILGGHKGEINSLAVHPSGKLAFSVARDKTLRMWNLVKGRSAYIRRLEKEAMQVLISPEGSKYALCFGRSISVFSTANAESIGTIEHKSTMQCCAFVGENHIVTGGDDRKLSIWQTNGRLVARVGHSDLTARVRCVETVERDGQEWPWIVLATSNGTVQVWDVQDFTFDEQNAEETNAGVEPVQSVALHSSPRITCLTACLIDSEASDKVSTKVPRDETEAEVVEEPQEAHASSGAHVVVEVEGEEAEKPSKRRARGKSRGRKRKALDSVWKTSKQYKE